MSDVEKKSPPPIAVNFNEKTGKGAWVAFPRFFVDEFFGASFSYTQRKKKNGKAVDCDSLPAAWWKYILFIWRWVTLPNDWEGHEYHTDKSMRQIPLRGEAATKWTAALSVSGVINVALGKWEFKQPVPTQFELEPRASHLAWRCFLKGLSQAHIGEQTIKSKMTRNGEKVGANTEAWRLLVAAWVDHYRAEAGLPRLHTNLLQNTKAAQYKHEKPRRRADESIEDFEERLAHDDRYEEDVRERGGFPR